MNNKVISERLKKMRKEKGLTQKELAKRLGVALSVISGAETKTGVSKSLAMKLSNFFNTSLDYWINENAELEFIQNHDMFETTRNVVERLIKENIISSNNIDNVDKEVLDLINTSILFDIKVELKKRES